MAFFDTYYKVMGAIDLSMSGQEIVLEDLLKDISLLFQEFQMELATSDEAGSRELIKLMNALHKKLDAHGKSMAQRLGMSPEVMQHVADNKENFTQSQLAWVEKAKKSIESAGHGLESKKGISKPVDLQHDRQKSSPSKGSRKRPKQSDWLKS